MKTYEVYESGCYVGRAELPNIVDADALNQAKVTAANGRSYFLVPGELADFLADDGCVWLTHELDGERYETVLLEMTEGGDEQ